MEIFDKLSMNGLDLWVIIIIISIANPYPLRNWLELTPNLRLNKTKINYFHEYPMLTETNTNKYFQNQLQSNFEVVTVNFAKKSEETNNLFSKNTYLTKQIIMRKDRVDNKGCPTKHDDLKVVLDP